MRTSTLFYLSLLAPLAACGGGGGGSSGSPGATTAGITNPVPAQIAPFTAGQSNDAEVVGFGFGCAANPCGLGTPTASATANSSSVTLGADSLTLNITEGGASYSHVFTTGTDTGAAPGFITIDDGTDAVHYNGSINPADPSNLQYVTYGTWATTTGPASGGYGAFAAGTLTPTGNMPITMSATYNGAATGLLSVGDGNLNILTGTMTANANFGGATPSISGSANLNVTGDSVTAPGNTGFWNIVDFNANITGNHFAGTTSSAAVTNGVTVNGNTSVLTTPAMTGNTSGAFYGPQATNIGGVFNLSGGGSQAVGAFAGLSQGLHH